MKKFVYILLLLISMGTMHYFSSQDGSTSKAQSNAVIEIIDDIRDKVTIKNEKLKKINEAVMKELKKHKKSLLVRKAAHFTMYAVIGGTAMLVIYSFSKHIFLSATLSFTLAFLYAVFDERSQIAVDGRSGSFTDVLIDSSGALLAIFILAILFLLIRGILIILNKIPPIKDKIKKIRIFFFNLYFLKLSTTNTPIMAKE